MAKHAWPATAMVHAHRRSGSGQAAHPVRLRRGQGWLWLMTLLAASALGSPAEMPARGHLLIIGGGKRGPEIMQTFVRLAGAAQGRVAVFPMASSVPHEVGPEQVRELQQAGLAEVKALMLTRAQAESDSAVRLLDGVTGVFFSGGDQSRLTAVLKGTKVEARLRELYRQGAVMAGTSAGAAVMSAVMITGEERRPVADSTFNTIEADNIITSAGFGFLEEAIVDQHFVRRRRHNRLLSLVLERPHLVGLGIDEATALWVKPDRTCEVIGAGVVVVYDARRAQIAQEEGGHGLSAAEMRLHVLRQPAVYDLHSGKVKRLKP